MRAGEFTSRSAQDFDSSSSLTPHDISVDQHANSSIVCIHLKQSKTDPFGHGVDIYIGRTGTDLCLAGVILVYMAIRQPLAGPLFIVTDR